jgi:hypothetical protein
MLPQGLLQHVSGLRHRPVNGIYDQQTPVGHIHDAFNLAAEVSVTGCIDDVDLHAFVSDGSVLGKNRNAPFPLQRVGIHDKLSNLLVDAKDPALL